MFQCYNFFLDLFYMISVQWINVVLILTRCENKQSYANCVRENLKIFLTHYVLLHWKRHFKKHFNKVYTKPTKQNIIKNIMYNVRICYVQFVPINLQKQSVRGVLTKRWFAKHMQTFRAEHPFHIAAYSCRTFCKSISLGVFLIL